MAQNDGDDEDVSILSDSSSVFSKNTMSVDVDPTVGAVLQRSAKAKRPPRTGRGAGRSGGEEGRGSGPGRGRETAGGEGSAGSEGLRTVRLPAKASGGGGFGATIEDEF